MDRFYDKKKDGFIVLMTAIIIAVVVASGIGLIKVAVRELALTRVGTESMRAFNVTDTILEEVKYRDFINPEDPLNPPEHYNYFFPPSTGSLPSGCIELLPYRICTYTFSHNTGSGCGSATIIKELDTSTCSDPDNENELCQGLTIITATGDSKGECATPEKSIRRIIRYQYTSHVPEDVP